jgi:hypothetical protein
MAGKDDAAANVTEELASPELDAMVAAHEPVGGAEFVPGQPEPSEMGNAKCVAMGLEMAVAMGKAYFPSLERTAPPEKCQEVANSVGAVLDKYGVAAGGWLSQYGAELGALVTCSTFGFGVYAGIKADIAAREAEAVQRPAPPPANVPEMAPAKPADEAGNLPGWKDLP